MTDPLDHGAARQPTSRGAYRPSAKFEEPEDEVEFRTWTREEAAVLRARQPALSPWRVVAAQAAVGLLCFAAAWVLFQPRFQPQFQQRDVAWSVLYGAAVAVLPAALLARGMSRDLRANAGAAMFGFMFWELVKIGVTVAMLLAAPRVVHGLSWPALLVALIVCTKVNWLALLWRRRGPKNSVDVATTTPLKT